MRNSQWQEFLIRAENGKQAKKKRREHLSTHLRYSELRLRGSTQRERQNMREKARPNERD